MGRFELLEHTADIGLVAYGADLREAFAAAAEGLFSVMADLSTVHPVQCYEIRVEADDLESLLVAWLNELLYLFDTENVLLRAFSLHKISPNHLLAEACGERYDPARHRLNLGVKAATYHSVSVNRNDEVTVRVILDV